MTHDILSKVLFKALACPAKNAACVCVCAQNIWIEGSLEASTLSKKQHHSARGCSNHVQDSRAAASATGIGLALRPKRFVKCCKWWSLMEHRFCLALQADTWECQSYPQLVWGHHSLWVSTAVGWDQQRNFSLLSLFLSVSTALDMSRDMVAFLTTLDCLLFLVSLGISWAAWLVAFSWPCTREHHCTPNWKGFLSPKEVPRCAEVWYNLRATKLKLQDDTRNTVEDNYACKWSQEPNNAHQAKAVLWE